MDIIIIYALAGIFIISLFLFIIIKIQTKRKISLKDRLSLEGIIEGEIIPEDIQSVNQDDFLANTLSKKGEQEFDYEQTSNSDFSSRNKKGLTLLKEGKFEEAIDFFELAVQNNPADAEAYYNRGLAKSKLNYVKDAIDDITDAMLRQLRNPDAFYQRGKLFIKIGDKEKALRDFTEYISLRNSNAYAYYLKGTLEFDKENFKESIEDFSAAIALDKNLADAYFKRGLAKHNTGYEFNACKDLKTAFEKGNLEAYHYLKLYCK